MPRVDPATAAQRWSQGLGAATQKITEGIARVSTAPGQKAAAKKGAYLAGVQANVDNWAANVARVSLGEWQDAATSAVGRVADGASRKAPKFQDRITPVFAHMQGVENRVNSMPSDTLEQRINKATEFMRGMAQYKRRAAGG